MKKIIIFTLAIFLFNACEESELWTKATIIGPNLQLTSTCSSDYLMTIENDTFAALLETDFDFDAYPAQVKIKYNTRDVCNWIEVYEIKPQ